MERNHSVAAAVNEDWIARVLTPERGSAPQQSCSGPSNIAVEPNAPNTAELSQPAETPTANQRLLATSNDRSIESANPAIRRSAKERCVRISQLAAPLQRWLLPFIVGVVTTYLALNRQPDQEPRQPSRSVVTLEFSETTLERLFAAKPPNAKPLEAAAREPVSPKEIAPAIPSIRPAPIAPISTPPAATATPTDLIRPSSASAKMSSTPVVKPPHSIEELYRRYSR